MKNLGPYEINNIYAGECSEMMKALPDGCIDLTVTSPPYDNLREYKGYVFDYKPVIEQLYRVTKPGGVVVWVVADATINGSETGTSFKQALYGVSVGFNLHDTMIYLRSSPNTPESNRYGNVFEYMFVFSKDTPKTFNLLKDRKNKYAGTKIHGTQRNKNGDLQYNKSNKIIDTYGPRFNVWQIENYTPPGNKHPAIFPEALARDHILTWSNKDEIVLDPFMGSGTTAKMAMQNGRNFLGFDISPEYVELAKKRVVWANPPLLVIG
jgi:site-specific DNA-methyltransferase (adenine-specific)